MHKQRNMGWLIVVAIGSIAFVIGAALVNLGEPNTEFKVTGNEPPGFVGTADNGNILHENGAVLAPTQTQDAP